MWNLTTLYTGPKPPSPNMLLGEKWFVAAEMVEKSNIVDNSTSSFSLLYFQWNIFSTSENNGRKYQYGMVHRLI